MLVPILDSSHHYKLRLTGNRTYSVSCRIGGVSTVQMDKRVAIGRQSLLLYIVLPEAYETTSLVNTLTCAGFRGTSLRSNVPFFKRELQVPNQLWWSTIRVQAFDKQFAAKNMASLYHSTKNHLELLNWLKVTQKYTIKNHNWSFGRVQLRVYIELRQNNCPV
jgi:hypothetical protein